MDSLKTKRKESFSEITTPFTCLQKERSLMKLACITGASSGIGKEFAYLLSDLEYDLILVGRNSAALHEIADNVAVRCKCIM